MIEAHKVTDLEGQSFENAIKTDFGFDIKNAEKVVKGYSSQVYKANFDNKDVYIRINKDQNVFEVEKIGYKIFEEKGIPVPKIIAYNPNPKSIGHPTVIMTSAIGVSFSEANLSQEEQDVVYEKLGGILNKINGTKLNGYGKLKVKNDELVGEFSTWRDYSESQNEHNNKALNFCIENKYITNEEAIKVREIYKEIPLLDISKASLVHRDIHRGHFFVQGPEVTGIIDLGSIMAGDPRYDVAMALVFQDNNQQEYFKKGYSDALVDDPMVNKYMITIFIRKLFFRSRQEIKGNVEVLLSPLKDSLNKLA